MSKNPNPQGKGGAPVLATLNDQRAALAEVPPKKMEQVSTELFTSLFVLESEFNFEPVQGKRYFMYRQRERFWLSLTPPQMWSEAVSGRFIGTCQLQEDMTWTLELDDAVANDAGFMAYLEQQRAAFEQRLHDAETVDDVLPEHERGYTFHRRASAFALAYSLGRSMQQTGLRGLSYEQALGELSHDGGDDDADTAD